MSPILQSKQDCINYLRRAKIHVIARLAQESRQTHRPADSEQAKALKARLEELLTYLEDNEVDRATREDTKIHEALKLIHTEGNNFHFEEDFVKRARGITEKWQAERPVQQPAVQNAGIKREASSSDDEVEAIRSPKSPKRRNVASSSGSAAASASASASASTSVLRPTPQARQDSGNDDAMANIKPPPYNHPIWGRDGIMHGLAHKRGSGNRKTTVINPEYKHLQRPAKVFGHNDITVGRWFPFQISAVFHGAHGQVQAGISGSAEAGGAYSIVVSGEYEDLDHDTGNILYYSGSGSHNNTNPRETPASTSGTLALHASLNTGNPVRVLRSHSGGGRFAPSKGLRYDGLYRVTEVRTPRNMKGGLYEQFKLERISREEDDLQVPIDQCKARPNGPDLRDYERIELGYQSRR